MRIAYCMLVYKDPDQVSRLVRRLYSSSDFFYVHIDRRRVGIIRKYGRHPSDERWEDLARKHDNLFLASRYKTGRNSFRLVEATLDGMNSCQDWDYDYFVILSGQCYPIKPLSVLKEELGRKNVAHMEYFKFPYEHWEHGGLNRISYYHIATGDERWGIRIPRLNRTVPYGLEPYGGGDLCCLPRKFVDYVLDYVSTHPKIVNFYKYSFMSGEMFFHTIIMNSPLKCDVVNDPMWYVRWPGQSGGHPAILRKEDFNEIVQSGKFFARKFDINIDSDILDLIDREIHQTEIHQTDTLLPSQ